MAATAYKVNIISAESLHEMNYKFIFIHIII